MRARGRSHDLGRGDDLVELEQHYGRTVPELGKRGSDRSITTDCLTIRSGRTMKLSRYRAAGQALAGVCRAGALLALTASASEVRAANATWTASSNGAWDTGSNWNGGAAASGASSTATFGNATGTGISINTAVTIGTLQFNSGAPAYNIAVNSNSSLTLSANGIVNNSSNPLSLTVNSNARVNFEGNSTAANSVLFLNSGGILDFSRSTGTITAGSIAGSASTNIYLGNRTLTTGSLNTSTLFQGVISDGGNAGTTGGSLTKTGTGTLTLDRDNTYTGVTTISNGVLQIGNGGSTGSILGNVVNNASLVFNRGATSTYSGTISGTGSVTKSGGGTVTLTGTNTYGGGTRLNGGSLQVSSNANLGNTSGSLTFNGGSLLYGAGFSSARSVVLTGAGTFNTSSFSSSLTGVISGAGTLTKSGSGTLTLTGTNTYTANTMVSGGTLQIGNAGTSGSILGNVAVSSGATLAFSRSDSQSFSSVISGSGSLNKLGTNTLTLSGANTYSGGTSITGTLIVLGAHTGGGTATINSGGTLQIGNGGTSGSIASGIANGGALVFNRSDNLSYGGLISGSGTLTKQGAGTLVLSANSTYTGLTTISGGTLQIGNGGTTGMIGGHVVNNGVLAFNRSDDFTFAGDISGTGSLVKDGAGTLTLLGTLSFTGTTSILGGALLIGNGGNTGGLVGDLVIDSELTFNRADDYLYSGVLSGTGSFVKLGAGKLTFTGENLYTGGTTISQGTLQLGNGGTTGSIVGNVLNNSVLAFNRSDSTTFAGNISGTGSVSKLGAGTLTLSGANSYSGTTLVEAGTLRIGGAHSGGGSFAINTGAALQLGNLLNVPIVNNGTLEAVQSTAGTYGASLSGMGSFTKQGQKLTLTGANTYTGASTFTGEVELSGSGATLNGTSGITLAPFASFAQATLRVSGGSIVTPGSIVVGDIGTGWLTLSSGGSVSSASAVLGANAGSSGNALIAGGTSGGWQVSGPLVVGAAGTGALTVENNSLLRAGSIVLSQQSGSSGTLSIGLGGSAATIDTASVTGGAGATGLVSFNTNDPAYVFAPLLAGNLRVEKRGSGSTSLTGANTYTGGTTIRSGTLSITADANLGDASGGVVFEGGTLAMNGASVARAITLSTGGGTIFTDTSAALLSGSISGAGDFRVTGGGQLNLAGVSTYTGATSIGASVKVDGGILNGTSGIVVAAAPLGSGSLTVDGPLSSVRTIGSLVVGQGGSGTLNVKRGSLLTSAEGILAANTGSSGAATIDGAGSLWSNVGELIVGGLGNGSLTVSDGGVVSASQVVLGESAGASGTLNIGIGGAAGALNTATVVGGAGATSLVNFNHDETAYLVASQLGGSLAVNQIGSGTTILTAANTYTGLTTISGGTLQIGNGGTTGSIVGDILNNGTLLFNRSDDFTFAGAISGTGSLIKDGAGTLTLTGSVSYTGTTTVRGGALLIGTGGTGGNWDGDLDISSTLTFNRSDDVIYGHVISGSGSLIKLGAGMLTLTNANTYIGGTTISTGTLRIGNGGTTGSIVGNIVNNASLAFNRVDDVTFGGLISGTGSLTKIGVGTLTLTAANTYAGGTSILAGTLQVGSGGTSGSLAGDVANEGALIFNRSDSSSYSGAISGSGTVSKLGAGALTLTGHSTYTGATAVTGTLNVLSGGKIDGTSGVTVAPGASQSGLLRVSGAGSRVSTAGTIVVGGLGSGTLTVDNGGAIDAASILLGAEVGSSGTLNIGSGGDAGFLNATTVVDGAGAGSAVHLSFTDSSYVLASNLLHTLSVNQDGPGTVVLTGVNSYTGGTFLNAGTLRVASNSNLGGAASALYFNGGTLQWGATVTNLPRAINLGAGGGTLDTGTFNVTSTGVISGAGSFTKKGTGVLTLTGTNTYTGNLIVEAGTLRGNSSSLRNNILNDAAVDFLQTASGTYSGVMSGTGALTKLNAGNLTLTGVNTYTGATTISSGTLTVQGSLSSPVTVGESGTLAGTGTINRDVSVGGVLAPGHAATAPFGTLTINGNVTFASGSVLRVQTNELGANSKVSVVGAGHNAVINGGTLELLTGGGEYAPHSTYTVVSAVGGVTGAFDDVTSDFAFLTPSVTYNPNAVVLALDRNDMAFTAFAREAKVSEGATEVARYLDTLSANSEGESVVRRITPLSTSQAARSLEDLSAGGLTKLSQASLQNTARLAEMLATRLDTGRAEAGTGLAFSTLSTGGARAVSFQTDGAPGSGMWVRQLAAEPGRGDVAGGHTAVGMDAVLDSATVVGMSAVYTRYDIDLGSGMERASRVRTPRLMGYIGHDLDGLQVRGIAGCARHRFDTTRSIALGKSRSIASANRSADECSAYVQAEVGRAQPLRPILGLMYSRLDESAYVETGGEAALAVGRHSTESVISNLGVRYSGATTDRRASFEARAVWSHEYGAADSPFAASFANVRESGRFLIRGDERPRDSLTLGSGVAGTSGRLMYHSDYNLKIDAEGRTTHTFVAGLRFAF